MGFFKNEKSLHPTLHPQHKVKEIVSCMVARWYTDESLFYLEIIQQIKYYKTMLYSIVNVFYMHVLYCMLCLDADMYIDKYM